MKDRKVIFNRFAEWENDKAISTFNRMSDEGWQLSKVGNLTITFIRNEAVRYRYQIDFNTAVDSRYREIFREQGWELVTTSMNSSYLRRLFDPALPESEYEIYTDEQSYKEVLAKPIKRYTWLSIAYFLMSFSYGAIAISPERFDAMYMLISGMMLLCAVMFSIIGAQLRRKRKGKSCTVDGMAVCISGVVALIVFLGMVVAIMTNMIDDTVSLVNLDTQMQWETCDSDTTYELDFTIDKAGYYYLDLDCGAESGAVNVTIENAEGEVLFDASPDGLEYSVEDECIRFVEGDYVAILSSEAGTTNATFDIRLDRPWIG